MSTRPAGGHPVNPVGFQVADGSTVTRRLANLGAIDDVQAAHRTSSTYYSFGNVRDNQVVRAAIWLPGNESMLVVRKSLDEIPGAVEAVRRAFAIAAGRGLA